MVRIAGFTPERARELAEVADYLRSAGFLTRGDVPTPPLLTPPTPYYVYNDSGAVIPPYACMQVTGTRERGGQNYLDVKKPLDITATAGGYLFNGHREIAVQEEGIAQFGHVQRAYKNSGTITAGGHWSPVVSQWYLASDSTGPFIAAGADDIDTDVLRVFVNSSSPTDISVFVTPGGGIAARSGATLGSATCTKYTVTAGTRASTATTATVYNDFTSAIGASRDIIAAKINGIWVVIAENCP